MGGPWSPEAQKFLPWSPEPKVFYLLGPWTKMMFLAKLSPGVKPGNPRATIFLCWGPGALNFLARRPG